MTLAFSDPVVTQRLKAVGLSFNQLLCHIRDAAIVLLVCLVKWYS
jgi:hypothetical protein